MKTVESPTPIVSSLGANTALRAAAQQGLPTLLIALAPLYMLGSSASGITVTLSHAALATTLIYSIVVWRADTPHSLSIGFCIGGILLIGVISVSFAATATWTAVLQLIVLERVLGRQRTLILSKRARSAIVSIMWFGAAASVVIIFVKPQDGIFERLESGPFGNPNALGLAALVIAIEASLLAAASPPSSFRFAMRTLFVLSAIVVVLSRSRTSLGALVLFLMTYSVKRLVRHGRIILTAIFIATLVAVPVLTVAYGIYFSDDLVGVSFGNKALLTGRPIIWKLAAERCLQMPILGHGIGRVPGNEFPPPYDNLSSHNGFLQKFYQVGVVGLVLYFALFTLVFRRAISLPGRAARSAAVAVLCAAMFCEIFEVVLTENHFGFGIVFWILITTTIAADPTRISISKQELWRL